MRSYRPPLLWKPKFDPEGFGCRPYKHLALDSGLRPRALSAAARRAQARVIHLTLGRDLHSDRRQVDVPVSSCGQPGADSRLLPLRDAGPRGRQIVLQKALANPDNRLPHVFASDGLHSYPAALESSSRKDAPRCRQRTRRYCNNRIKSDHRHIKRRLRAMQGPPYGGDGVGSDSRD